MSIFTGVACYAESNGSATSTRSSGSSCSKYVPFFNATEEDGGSKDNGDAAYSAAAVVSTTDTVVALRPVAIMASPTSQSASAVDDCAAASLAEVSTAAGARAAAVLASTRPVGAAAGKTDMVADAVKLVQCVRYVANVWTIDWETAMERYAADLERMRETGRR